MNRHHNPINGQNPMNRHHNPINGQPAMNRQSAINLQNQNINSIQPQINRQNQNTPPQVARRNIIFYSELCDSCTNLRTLMHNENILHFFEKQCIDKKEDYYKKIGITHVPTLIVSDIPKPLVSIDAFKWLKDIKCLRYQNMINNNNKIIQYNMNKNMHMDGPNAYVSTEMSGMSDTFAYTDTDMAQPKSFSYGTEDAIYTAPTEDDKLTNVDQEKLIYDAHTSRKNQEKEFDNIMKKGQLQAIIKAEQNQLNNY
jgi:hypothetical protein